MTAQHTPSPYRYIIAKSAGDDFSFTTQLVTARVGYQPEYAEELALEVTAAMKAARTIMPIMLEALDCIELAGRSVADIMHAKGPTNDPLLDERLSDLWNAANSARAAIAKAKGETP